MLIKANLLALARGANARDSTKIKTLTANCSQKTTFQTASYNPPRNFETGSKCSL
jgi:hypothetical protein